MPRFQNGYDEVRAVLVRRIDDARAAETAGNLTAARGLWQKAGDSYRRLADAESNMIDRARLFKKASDCSARAGNLGVARPPTAHEPLGQGSGTEDFARKIDAMIFRSQVRWEDIGGMRETKQELRYAMGLQLARQPSGCVIDIPGRILLDGPPGTGKTLLASACANMLGATFFNVKTSDLLSKYFGESSQLISALYRRARDVAEDKGLAVIFIDEVESLVPDRDAADSGAEKRIVTSFLSELDGLSEKKRRSGVITIVATNKPGALDPAIVSRMDLRIHVPLPDGPTREEIFRLQIEENGFELAPPLTCAELAALTEGKAGRDIQRVCKKVLLHVLKECNQRVPELVASGEIGRYALQTRPFTRADFEQAFRAA
ncbi:MAG TPA: ATP-binding protein [Opitutaceae bacterium]|jgi:SpoVK/Ycf46/Vps4 family AAA+-type ATPase